MAAPKKQEAVVVADDYQKIQNIDVTTYLSLPWMTKYEFDQIIGLRTMHLAIGAQPFVNMPDNFTIQTNMELRQIALQELKEKKLPYIVKRPMPNGEAEYWPVDKLNLETVEYMFR